MIAEVDMSARTDQERLKPYKHSLPKQKERSIHRNLPELMRRISSGINLVQDDINLLLTAHASIECQHVGFGRLQGMPQTERDSYLNFPFSVDTIQNAGRVSLSASAVSIFVAATFGTLNDGQPQTSSRLDAAICRIYADIFRRHILAGFGLSSSTSHLQRDFITSAFEAQTFEIYCNMTIQRDVEKGTVALALSSDLLQIDSTFTGRTSHSPDAIADQIQDVPIPVIARLIAPRMRLHEIAALAPGALITLSASPNSLEISDRRRSIRRSACLTRSGGQLAAMIAQGFNSRD